MPLISRYARKEKLAFFVRNIPKESKILEIGCADGWLGRYLKTSGYKKYVSLDILPPADIIGNIRDWRKLGIQEESFDVIIAFETIEHVDCFQEIFDILRHGGILMMTSPVPHMDWLCILLEKIGLLQKRTSPHTNLTYFQNIPFFKPLEIKKVWFLAQWGKFIKPV